MLFYVKGGAAWTQERADDSFTIAGIAADPSSSTIRTGWTVGTGLEWAFARHWSATVEYNYYDFGSSALRLTAPNTSVTFDSFKDTIHAVTVGVNYRF